MYNGYQHDRRRFHRLKANLSVVYRLIEAPRIVCRIVGPNEFEGTMLDLSQNGTAFLAKHSIPEGAVVLMKFILSKCDDDGLVSFREPIEVKGRVCSSLVWKINQYRLGICFDEIKVEQRFKIFNFVCSTLKPYSFVT